MNGCDDRPDRCWICRCDMDLWMPGNRQVCGNCDKEQRDILDGYRKIYEEDKSELEHSQKQIDALNEDLKPILKEFNELKAKVCKDRTLGKKTSKADMDRGRDLKDNIDVIRNSIKEEEEENVSSYSQAIDRDRWLLGWAEDIYHRGLPLPDERDFC